mmetsp:Transcript_49713/g.158788  ORF Transcript_49713/g.158788 Transcript_49713/m.158788 type:complete len:245 (-) Transcript_49713:1500-2234(-)
MRSRSLRCRVVCSTRADSELLRRRSFRLRPFSPPRLNFAAAAPTRTATSMLPPLVSVTLLSTELLTRDATDSILSSDWLGMGAMRGLTFICDIRAWTLWGMAVRTLLMEAAWRVGASGMFRISISKHSAMRPRPWLKSHGRRWRETRSLKGTASLGFFAILSFLLPPAPPSPAFIPNRDFPGPAGVTGIPSSSPSPSSLMYLLPCRSTLLTPSLPCLTTLRGTSAEPLRRRSSANNSLKTRRQA